MKALELNQMEQIEGGWPGHTLCFFAPTLWVIDHANVVAGGAMGTDALVEACWNS